MPITILDCAKAIKEIYKNQDFTNFNLIQGFYDPKNEAVGMEGYSVGVYKYLGGGNSFLISMRGSAKGKTTKDWVDDDVSIGLGRSPDRTNDARNYTYAVTLLYPNASILLAGHSLGGHLAQVIGLELNLPFVTFNAPPALGFFTNRIPGGRGVRNFNQGLNFRVNYDPVSKASGKHVGPLVQLPLNGNKVIDAHKASVVVDSVQASGLGNHDAMAEIALRNP